MSWRCFGPIVPLLAGEWVADDGEPRMIWNRIGEAIGALTGAIGQVGQLAGDALSQLTEAVRTAFAGDPETRRRVAFSIAMIALSAKMAKADGIVTSDEVAAFERIFEVPAAERRNVARVYDIAKGDVAGFEVYAAQLAELCDATEPGCALLEDILDGLFHIAKADGVIHEAELAFLARVAEIFSIADERFEAITARHAVVGEGDPYAVLGLSPGATAAEARRRWRELVVEHHPDRAVARGLPEEFVAIANERVAAFNEAYERIRRSERSPERAA